MRRSVLVAAGLVIGLSVWLLSGHTGNGVANTQHVRTAAIVPADTPLRVRVRTQQAQEVTREIVLHGHTAPTRTVTVRAEVPGQVTAIRARRGARIKRGEPLVHLKLDDRTARLDQVKALIRQREREYTSAQTLSQKGYMATIKVEEAFAALQAARAEFEHIQVDVANTTLRASFDGVLHERLVEVGDYVTPGTAVATIVDTHPLIVTGQVAQQQVSQLRVGGRGTARLVTGQTVEGSIRYIAATANEATRTFTVELAIPNPHGTLAAGVSSEMRFPVETLHAHLVSPALLCLDDAGILGVKSVNDDGVVIFHSAYIVRTNAQGVWLADLPTTLRFITVGQGFVRPGERVQAVPEEAAGSHSVSDPPGARRPAAARTTRLFSDRNAT